jgi:hypothetical protein
MKLKLAQGKSRRILDFVINWLTQFWDPIRFLRACVNLPAFLKDWRTYSGLPGAEPIHLLDTGPQLHDRTTRTLLDAHYFHLGGWAFRLIVRESPLLHVDVGSHHLFVSMLAAVVPVAFVDWRPFPFQAIGVVQTAAGIRRLPFGDGSISSLSCLHVAEHIGLGRYGDALDPLGTRRAASELQRVLAPGGALYFALPVGTHRLCFNSHRVHHPEQIVEFFPTLRLAGFSAVSDTGILFQDAYLTDFGHARNACGLYHFVKPAQCT